MRAAVPLSDRSPETPRALERIIMRLIERSPNDRYGSAEVVAEQLSTYLRSITRETRSALLRRALVEAGLVKGPNAAAEPLRLPARRDAVRAAWFGFALIGLLFAVATGLVQWSAWGARSGLRAGAAPLRLMPSERGFLRVVATPWAEVFVDGEAIDVTPFARSIPLSAGTHYLVLKHPDAPDENRTIDVVAGETMLLSVTMRVEGSSPDGGT
jgi:serine/threonine-protein kinase